MAEVINVVSIGGGNGHGAVAAAMAKLRSPIRATFIIAASDGGPGSETSTDRLSRVGNMPGYYGDMTRVARALCSALYPWDAFQERLAIRVQSGIAKGQSFGDLLADVLGPTFQRAMKGDHWVRLQAISHMRSRLNLDRSRDGVVRELITGVLEYPLEEDSFPRHSRCNILLFAFEMLAKQKDIGFDQVLEAWCVACNVPGQFRFVPATWKPHVLKAKTKEGRLIEGQYLIDFRDRDPHFRAFDEILTKDIWLDPVVPAAEGAQKAILGADVVIIPCGSIKGNVNAPFLAEGMKEALQERSEWFRRVNGRPLPIIYVMNLMNEPGNTLSGKPCTAEDVLSLVGQAIGRRPNRVIYDKTHISRKNRELLLPQQKIELGSLKMFETSRELEWPLLIAEEVSMIVPDDDPEHLIKIVHDPDKLAKVIARIFSEVLAGVLS